MAISAGCGGAEIDLEPPSREEVHVRLSANQTQACASCHHQDLAFSDGAATPSGSTGDPLVRDSQSLTNVAYDATLTWANPVAIWPRSYAAPQPPRSSGVASDHPGGVRRD